MTTDAVTDVQLVRPTERTTDKWMCPMRARGPLGAHPSRMGHQENWICT